MAIHHAPPDLSPIDEMDMPDDAKERLRQAWIEAAGIQRKFEPTHIAGWQDLLDRLEEVHSDARRNAALFGQSEQPPPQEGLLRRFITFLQRIWRGE